MKSRIPESVRPTMRDVANRAGVSPSAVSLALRNHPSVSAQTRERILRAQRDLGYTVNRHARELFRTTRRPVDRIQMDQVAFCLLGVSFEDPAYAPFLQGIATECQEHHKQLFTQSLLVTAEGNVALSNIIRDGGVDGIVVSGNVTDANLAFFKPFKIPVVVLGNYHLQTRVARVEVDMHEAGKMMAENLLAQGHRHMAFVVQELLHPYKKDCLNGVRACLQNHGLTLPDSHVIASDQFAPPVTALVDPFLRLDPMPTAVMTTDVRVADDLVAELRVRQIEIPGRLDVVALVNSMQTRHGIRYRRLNLGLERLGRLAVRRLAELVERRDVEPSVSVLPPLAWLEEAPVRQPS